MPDLHHQRVQELARRNAQHYTFRYRSLLLHWLGRVFRRAQPVEQAPPPPVEAGQVAVTLGGHAMVLVRYHRLSVLCDPLLARSVSGVPREQGPGLSLESLTDVDLVLVSHASPDHLDVGTLARLSRAATVVVPRGAAARVSPLGFARLVELSVGSSLHHRGLEVVAEDAQHGDRGSPSLSYILRGEGPTVYFCGGSGYFPGFADIGRRHWPDVALLPIGGYSPRSFRKRHMSPLDALYAFEDLRARVMVPIRHGAFALSYERLAEPARWLAELAAERHLERFVVRLAAGESRVFVPPGATGHDVGRYEVGVESGRVTAPAASIARVRQAAGIPPERMETAEPDAMTSVVGPSGVAAAGGAGPGRRRQALIVDHEDETNVFDRPGEPRIRRTRDAEDDEDPDEATRAMVMALPEAEPVAGTRTLPVRGSR